MDFIRRLFKNPFFENILTKPVKTSNSLLGKILPGNYLYHSPSLRNYNRNGIKLRLDISDYLQHYIYFNYRDKSVETLCSLVKPGMTVLDIGTNIGYIALKLAQKTGAQGSVYAFEPDSENFGKAVYNIQLNTWCKNISIENMGLGNKKGQYKLYAIDEKNKGMHQVQDKIIDKPYSTINIEVLDDIITEKKIPAPGLLKIDTEGYELNILKGAVNTLKKHKPILFVEVDDNNLKTQSSSAKELIAFIQEMGYSIMNADNNKAVLQSDDFKNCHFDCVCSTANTR